MLRAFALAVRQLGDPAILRVLAKSLAVTLLVFAALGWGTWWAAGQVIPAASGGVGVFLALVATILAGWLLFRIVAVAVLGLFADEVVAAVEARHYPAALATARPVSTARAVRMGIGSAGRVIAANLVALPLYGILLATGIGTAVGFLLVNGWLLGRDLGDMVASRHLPAGAMRGWRATTGWGRFATGLAAAGLFVVPGVNLLAPVLGAAMATHWFHTRPR